MSEVAGGKPGGAGAPAPRVPIHRFHARAGDASSFYAVLCGAIYFACWSACCCGVSVFLMDRAWISFISSFRASLTCAARIGPPQTTGGPIKQTRKKAREVG